MLMITHLSCPVLLPLHHLSLCIVNVSLGQGLIVYASFPPSALPDICGTMTVSDSPAPFGFLRLLRRKPYSNDRRATRVSRVTKYTLYIMPGSQTPGRLPCTSLYAQASVVFQDEQPVDPHQIYSNFGAQSLSGLMPSCQRLKQLITALPP